MARPEKIRLGDLLVQQKLLLREQLGVALERKKANGRKPGHVLVVALGVFLPGTRAPA